MYVRSRVKPRRAVHETVAAFRRRLRADLTHFHAEGVARPNAFSFVESHLRGMLVLGLDKGSDIARGAIDNVRRSPGLEKRDQ